MSYHFPEKRKSKLKRNSTIFLILLLSGMSGWGGYNIRDEIEEKGCIAYPKDVVPISLPHQSPSVVRFAAFGDTGTGSNDQRKVANALKSTCANGNCDFVLMLGDNFYPDGVFGMSDPQFKTAFEDMYRDVDAPFIPVLGNHDTRGQILPQLMYGLKNPQWMMPNYTYSFEAGPVQFHGLNTQCNILALTGLEVSDSATSPWKFVYAHHPIYSSGTHGDSDIVTSTIWDYYFADQVDFYLSGHDHEIEHLKNSGDRTEYVVSGAGGKHYRSSKERSKTTKSSGQSQFIHQDTGFAWFEVTMDTVLMKFIDGEGKTVYEYQKKR